MSIKKKQIELPQAEKEALEFIKSCSKMGVKEFHKHKDGYSVIFHKREAIYPGQENGIYEMPKSIKVSRQARRAADAIERQAKEHTEQMLQEEDTANRLVEDPERYEESLVEGIANGDSGG